MRQGLLRGRHWGGLAAALLCTTGACGPPIPAERPLPGSQENQDFFAPGERVELIEKAGHPSLQLVRRSGDPSGAVAVAVFPPGGSVASLQMAALVSHRLGLDAASRATSMKVHALGFVLSVEVSTGEQAASWMEQVTAALLDPVDENEAALLPIDEFLAATESRVRAPSAYSQCLSQLGAEGRAPITAARQAGKSGANRTDLELLRQATAISSRVGFSALGTAKLLDAVRESEEGAWVEGEAIDDSWTSEPRQIDVVEADGGRELRIAVRVPNTEAALATARALDVEDHPLHSRLQALDPRIEARQMEVTLRPAGACTGFTVALDAVSPAPTPERISEIALLAVEELEATLRQEAPEDEAMAALLIPQGAQEAAALAAWTAVRSIRTGAVAQEIVEYRKPAAELGSRADLVAAVNKTDAAWKSRSIPVTVRAEEGQPELWMLLASPCGTRSEVPEESGLRALTISALAQDFSGKQGVALDPWIGRNGIGLMAHAPAMRGESVAHHAERVARALGAAFSGPGLDGRAVAATRDLILDRVGTDPGEALIQNILGAGVPSAVQPWGLGKSLATFSVADTERTRTDIVQEPLRLAVLTNATEVQGKTASSALARWLAPARTQTTSCPDVKFEAIAPGAWTLTTIDEGVKTGAYLGVFAPASPATGQATAYLLNRSGGYLDRAFSAPGLVAHAEAEWYGGEEAGGIVIRVTTDEEHLPAAIAQARGVLNALASPGVPEDDAKEAVREYEEREADARRVQRSRLVMLYENTRADRKKPAHVTVQSLRTLHRALGEKQHRIVTVKHRK